MSTITIQYVFEYSQSSGEFNKVNKPQTFSISNAQQKVFLLHKCKGNPISRELDMINHGDVEMVEMAVLVALYASTKTLNVKCDLQCRHRGANHVKVLGRLITIHGDCYTWVGVIGWGNRKFSQDGQFKWETITCTSIYLLFMMGLIVIDCCLSWRHWREGGQGSGEEHISQLGCVRSFSDTAAIQINQWSTVWLRTCRTHIN